MYMARLGQTPSAAQQLAMIRQLQEDTVRQLDAGVPEELIHAQRQSDLMTGLDPQQQVYMNAGMSRDAETRRQYIEQQLRAKESGASFLDKILGSLFGGQKKKADNTGIIIAGAVVVGGIAIYAATRRKRR